MQGSEGHFSEEKPRTNERVNVAVSEGQMNQFGARNLIGKLVLVEKLRPQSRAWIERERGQREKKEILWFDLLQKA